MRIIHYGNDEGREGVYFTEQDDPAVDFVPVGCKLISETKIDDDLPSDFPLEYQLEVVR